MYIEGKVKQLGANGGSLIGTVKAGLPRTKAVPGGPVVAPLYGLPIITSVALTRATAASPGLRASSRTASAVMMAVTR